jgi:hypothetical protein
MYSENTCSAYKMYCRNTFLSQCIQRVHAVNTKCIVGIHFKGNVFRECMQCMRNVLPKPRRRCLSTAQRYVRMKNKEWKVETNFWENTFGKMGTGCFEENSTKWGPKYVCILCQIYFFVTVSQTFWISYLILTIVQSKKCPKQKFCQTQSPWLGIAKLTGLCL